MAVSCLDYYKRYVLKKINKTLSLASANNATSYIRTTPVQTDKFFFSIYLCERKYRDKRSEVSTTGHFHSLSGIARHFFQQASPGFPILYRFRDIFVRESIAEKSHTTVNLSGIIYLFK